MTPRRTFALGLALLALHASPAAAQPRTPHPSRAEPVNEARALFQRGIELVGEERWGEALEYFRRSRALSERPSTVFNIGSVLVRVGRMAEAIGTLEEFLRVSDPRANAAERREADRLLAEARAARVRLTLALNVPDAQLWVDGARVEGSGAERVVELDPGEHQLRLAAEGHEEASLSLSALPGQSLRREVPLPPRPTRIVLSVSPTDARVTLDGRDLGAERVLDVTPGRHRIGLRAEQHVALDREVAVRLGESLRLDLSLSRRPRSSVVASPWFWTAIGVAVVGAAVGVAVALTPTRIDPYGGTTDTVLSGLRQLP